MRILSVKLFSLLFILLLAASCSEEKEQFETESISDYTIPLQVGKYIIYRVDSLVFPNFGRSTEIHKYQRKEVVEAIYADNEGRPTYRINRYIRDSVNAQSWTAAQPWIANGTYSVTPVSDQLEVIENNLRFIKLHMPLKEGFNWKGNSFLPDDPYTALFGTFGNDDNMDKWEYYYDTFEPSFTYRNKTYPDVWTVEQEDFASNVPILDAAGYGTKSRAFEKYAKGLGLVYRQWELWEYQPNTTGTGGPYKQGFGITQWMIDHN